ncbi:MAG: 16S rRNA (cytosine(967)-C(5))-methyltransferase, partial [Gammaproteobacteria bacterium]|nr:16S rRNA (cytosine(967)-C(5))-methyltransferase [Gammaproteobacteria bacterium]
MMVRSEVNQSAREIVTSVLTEVISYRKNLDVCLSEHLIAIDDGRTKSLTKEICYGVMRWFYQLDSILNVLIPKPLKNKDTDLRVLLLAGIYQIKFLRTPDYATINESVETSKSIGKPWAAKLINAVLRRYQRERSDIDTKLTDSDVSNYAFPSWLLNRIVGQWPEYWQTILTASNQYPPLHLRLNTQIHNRYDYLSLLESHGINATLSAISTTGILLTEAMNVDEIPGFVEGDVSVQDTGAQLATPLLDCQPGHRVLDA